MALSLPTLVSLLFPMEIGVRAAGTDYERRLVQPVLLCLLGVTVPVQATFSCFSKFLKPRSDAFLCSTLSGYFTASWIALHMTDVCQCTKHCTP